MSFSNALLTLVTFLAGITTSIVSFKENDPLKFLLGLAITTISLLLFILFLKRKH